ncbi:hypothetical protein [Cobetia marina]|jgi:hypothetical protein|uniref:hypothetical protein n=1 Tax=Cobetia marina TaxID=28258 RepID=UPI00384A99C6
MEVRVEAINYAKDRYVEEQGRFNQAENKCAHIHRSLTLIIAFLGSIVGFKGMNLLSPTTLYEWFIFILILLSSFTLLCAWGHAFRALKITEWPTASRSRENCEYIFEQDADNSLRQILDCYVGSLEKLDGALDEKIKYLNYAYEELFYSVVFISLLSALIITGTFIK